MDKGAIISPCGRYRYMLWRTWDDALPLLVYVMLNPSTADGELDDATIRVCMGRAKQMGYGGIIVVNLFAWRATSPADMKAAEDPVGPENDAWIRTVVLINSDVIVAWGTHGTFKDRDKAVLRLLRKTKAKIRALRITKDGHPCHPLRIPYSEEPVEFLGKHEDRNKGLGDRGAGLAQRRRRA